MTDVILVVTFFCAFIILSIVLYSYYKYKKLYSSVFNIFIISILVALPIFGQNDSDINDNDPIITSIGDKPIILTEPLNKLSEFSYDRNEWFDECNWRSSIEIFLNDSYNNSSQNLTYF